jgi:hypothetical protein
MYEVIAGHHGVETRSFGVVRCCPFWSCEAEGARGRVWSQAACGRPAAMFRTPVRRRAPITGFLQVAIVRGAFPVRTWEVSPVKVTSLTWFRASTVQCPRISRMS